MTSSQIDKELQKSNFNSQEDLDSHVNHVLSLINSYEQDLYDKEEYDKFKQIQIRKWKQKLFNLQNYYTSDGKIPEILESTARIVNRQINKMDNNTGLLNKGTLKLMGLNYTNEDIDKALNLTNLKLNEQKKIENKEKRMVFGAFILFLIVCCCVVIDKVFKII